MLPVFRTLAKLRFLRGTAFDPFGRTDERRQERQLVADYRAWVESLLPRLEQIDFDTALALAKLPEQIRGFGYIKQESMAAAVIRREELMLRLERSGTQELRDLTAA